MEAVPILLVRHLGWEKARVVCHPPAAVRLCGTCTGGFFMGWDLARQASSPAPEGTEGLSITWTSQSGEGGPAPLTSTRRVPVALLAVF